MNLILLDPCDGDGSAVFTLSDARAAHLVHVLKVVPGHAVRVGMLDGPPGIGTITSVGDGRVTMRCVFTDNIPVRPPVDVLLALPRPKVMRRLWAQLAALGVGQIILTNAERVERDYFDSHILSNSCYRPLLIEGLQQARDTRLPLVSIHRQFKVLVEDRLDALFPDRARVVADPSAAESIDVTARGLHGHRLLVAIGPEGDWNAFELDLLRNRGFAAVGMGPRTLRTDTACIALLALAHRAMAAD